MNKQRICKLLALMLMLVLCLALTGCIKDPTQNNPIQPQSSWKTYTNQPTAGPENTENLVVTPTPSPDPNTQSWDPQPGAATNNIPGVATPVTAATDTPAPATPTPTAASGVLKRGSQGDAVKNVQSALKRLGYFEGKTDGDFGEYTENAVKKFQAQNGLTADGIVGQATLNKLSSSSAATCPPDVTATPKPTATPKTSNTYLSNGSSGKDVTQMQNRLISLGYLEGSASGKFCDVTEVAVIAFQSRSGLHSDGIAGPSTLDALYSSNARKANTAVGVIGVALKTGDNGDAVRLLQSKLKAYGFYKGSVDGDYGSGTADAVKAFQRANGLSADGKAGAETLRKLFAGSVTTASQATVTKKPTTKPSTATKKPTTKPTTKATNKPVTPTPNAYVRVTSRPDGEYFTLEKGMMGTPVKELQRALKNAGYFDGKVDGYYGEDTVEAVKDFQKSKGLKRDGKAGPATLRYLYEGDFPDGA